MTISEFIEASPRDTWNVIKAGIEKQIEEREEHRDYVRHVMWASLAAMGGKLKPSDLIKLERDKKDIDLTPYQKQEVDDWAKRMDEEMRQAGLL